MRFSVEQVFPGPLERVEAALLDSAFLERLATLPKLGAPQLLDVTENGTTVRRRVRYRFAGDLSPAVTAVVDPAKLTWVEDAVVDRTTHRTTFRILLDKAAGRGEMELVADFRIPRRAFAQVGEPKQRSGERPEGARAGTAVEGGRRAPRR